VRESRIGLAVGAAPIHSLLLERGRQRPARGLVSVVDMVNFPVLGKTVGQLFKPRVGRQGLPDEAPARPSQPWVRAELAARKGKAGWPDLARLASAAEGRNPSSQEPETISAGCVLWPALAPIIFETVLAGGLRRYHQARRLSVAREPATQARTSRE